MKLLNLTLIIVATLIFLGAFYVIDQNNDNNEEQEPTGSGVTTIYSQDKAILQIDEKIIYIIEGTVQTDVLENIQATDYSNQVYTITTSEGSQKSLDEIYEYDRLYVTAENGVTENYYTFQYVESLD